jgi:predicted aminopeptidase
VATLLLLGACAAPGYYTQAAAGHWELMRQREDIDALLANPATEPALAQRLALARDIRAFGIAQMGLPESGSYTRYVATGRDAVSWIVVAAPEFSLEAKTWCFLVAGCVPYRGYFEQADADRFAAKLRDKGYDVLVAGATAYSTLGWFDDPLLDTMFGRDDADLAGTLFHEMAHQRLYVADDTAFNESYASFVEEVGVQRWLTARGEPARFDTWLERRALSAASDEVIREHRDRLERLYSGGGEADTMRARKQAILAELCVELAALGAPAVGEDGDCAINNAGLALRQSYQGGFCAFETLYRSVGGDIVRFHERAAVLAEWPADDRSEWLREPCSAVAPNRNL